MGLGVAITTVFAHAGHWIELGIYLAPVAAVAAWAKGRDLRKKRGSRQRSPARSARAPTSEDR